MRVIHRAALAACALVLLVVAPAGATVTATLEPVPTGETAVAVARLDTGGTAAGWRLNATVVVDSNQGAIYPDSVGVTVGGETQVLQLPGTEVFKEEYAVGSFDGTGDPPATAHVVVRWHNGLGQQQPPIVSDPALKLFRPKVDGGGYYLPYRQAEVPTGAFWANGESTTPQSHHFPDPGQRWAYDLTLFRWDGTRKVWTPYKGSPPTTAAAKADPTKFLAWGQKVYAMAGGTVIECRDSMPNQAVGVKDEHRRFGNAIWIRTADGEYTAYAHLQQGSIPDDLCPTQSVSAWDGSIVHAEPVEVQAGQFLGLLGNTGNSSGPHTHLQLDRDAPVDVDDSDGRAGPALPLAFHRYQGGLDRNQLQAVAVATKHAPITAFSDRPDGDARVLPDFGLFKPNAPCALLPVAPGSREAALLGHTGTCFNEHLADIHRQGYDPVSLDGGRVAANTLYDVIARRNRPATVSLAGLTAAQFGTRDDQLGSQGLTLQDVDSYLVGTEVRLAGVWSAETQAPQVVETVLTAAQFKAENQARAAYGYVPAVVSPVGTANGTYYSVIYRQQFFGSTLIIDEVASGSFQTRFNQRVAAGLRPIWVEGFNLKSQTGTPTIVAVWTQNGSPNYLLKSNLTSAQWLTQWPKSLAAGFSTDALSVFAVSGAAHHATLWTATT